MRYNEAWDHARSCVIPYGGEPQDEKQFKATAIFAGLIYIGDSIGEAISESLNKRVVEERRPRDAL